MKATTPAQVREITGLKHHPTFDELIHQYTEGGPKISWNEDPGLILNSPAIQELTGMASAADDAVRDRLARDKRDWLIKLQARKHGLDFHTVRNLMPNVAIWANLDHPMEDDEFYG